MTGGELADRTFARMHRAGRAANFIGAMVVFAFFAFAFPRFADPEEVERLVVRSAVVLAVFIAVSIPLATRSRRRVFAPIDEWLRAGRAATEADRREVVRQPFAFVRVSAPFWIVGAVVFACVGSTESIAGVGVIATTVLLGGMATAALEYLLVEREMRPVTARALADGRPEVPVAPGVTTRFTMSWALGTAVPLLGVVALAIAYFVGDQFDARQTVGATLFLVVLALVVGLIATLMAARSVAEPVGAMRDAVQRVEAGDFAARVDVDDASEVGLLEAAFNRMAAGLAERERIRDTLGTYVDRDVAEHILREGTALEGEDVEVTAMFLDIRDFTGFAERSEARDVVSTLNRLFERVVPCVHEHGGHVDKFVGDGLLAVFGAPRREPAHADCALAAAISIAEAVDREFGGELSVGIGLNSGTVVAGNVGGGGRLEFSVIGDAVNVAARVESATRETGDVMLLSEHTYRALKEPTVPIDERPAVPLKGKSEPVALYAPRIGRPPPADDAT